MKNKLLYLLCLVLVLCMGCNRIETKKQKRITLDSLEVEFWRADSLCIFYQSKYDLQYDRKTTHLYSDSAYFQIMRMIDIDRKIIEVLRSKQQKMKQH